MRCFGQKDFYHGGICFITDRASCDITCEEMVLLALRSGVKWIQYRDKDKSRRNIYRTALRLRELADDFGACLIINDYVDIAAFVGADGVHLGQEDLPVKEARKILGEGKVIGISTHSLNEAVRAEKDGASYIGFGPVMHTATKRDAGRPMGIDTLKKIRDKVHIPVVAIGGINLDNIESVFSSGVQAVAVASGVLKGNIQHNLDGFVNKLSK